MSPALSQDFADSAPGAFDESDFRSTAVLGRQSDLDGVAVCVDCGASDPFPDVAPEYRDGLRRVRPAASGPAATTSATGGGWPGRS